jgi:hypothetical protein
MSKICLRGFICGAVALILVVLLASCSGNASLSTGKYCQIDGDGNINTESYITIVDDKVMTFTNVAPDKHIEEMYRNMASITVKDERTGEDVVIKKDGASDEEIALVRKELAHDLDGEIKYYYEISGNVHTVIAGLPHIDCSLEYFPGEKALEFYGQKFRLQ